MLGHLAEAVRTGCPAGNRADDRVGPPVSLARVESSGHERFVPAGLMLDGEQDQTKSSLKYVASSVALIIWKSSLRTAIGSNAAVRAYRRFGVPDFRFPRCLRFRRISCSGALAAVLELLLAIGNWTSHSTATW